MGLAGSQGIGQLNHVVITVCLQSGLFRMRPKLSMDVLCW